MWGHLAYWYAGESLLKELARMVVDALEAVGEELARLYRDTCTLCMACSSVCPSYLVTGNPRYTPAYRLAVAVRVLLGKLKPSPTDVESLFTCTGCGACSLACPHRMVIWLVIHLAKCVCHLRGWAPPSLQATVKAAEKSLHSFTGDHKLARRWIAEVKAWTGPGVYLYVPTPVENLFYFMEAQAKVKLFEAIGVPYTVSPLAQDVGGNMAVDYARPDIAAYALARALVEADERGARYIIVSECGADNKWVFELAPLLLRDTGLDTHRFKPIHEVILYYLRDKRPAKRYSVAGLFSSCTFGRIFPFYDNVKKIASLVAEQVEEPRWRARYVACCGGSCLNVLREPWARELRYRIGLSRVSSYNSTVILVPCTKCYISFKQSLLTARRRDKRIELVTTALLKSLTAKKG